MWSELCAKRNVELSALPLARARIVGFADVELSNYEMIVFVFEHELSLISHEFNRELKPLATLYCIILNCRR